MEDRLRRPAQTVRRPGDRRSVGQATDGQEARRQTVSRPGDRRSVGQATDGQEARRQTVSRPGDRRSGGQATDGQEARRQTVSSSKTNKEYVRHRGPFKVTQRAVQGDTEGRSR
jgi:hypothetical protein